MITFAALVATTLSLILPSFLNTMFITFLANLIIPAEAADFITQQYLPELAEASKGRKSISIEEKFSLGRRFAGMLVKIGWAFLW
jgi:hypothetical protein